MYKMYMPPQPDHREHLPLRPPDFKMPDAAGPSGIVKNDEGVAPLPVPSGIVKNNDEGEAPLPVPFVPASGETPAVAVEDMPTLVSDDDPPCRPAAADKFVVKVALLDDTEVDEWTYGWDEMIDILNDIEHSNPALYPGWMREGSYYDSLYDDVKICLHYGSEIWDISFPIDECMLEIRAHPIFVQGPKPIDETFLPARVVEDDRLEDDVLQDDGGQSAMVGELMQKLAEMCQVRVHKPSALTRGSWRVRLHLKCTGIGTR